MTIFTPRGLAAPSRSFRLNVNFGNLKPFLRETPKRVNHHAIFNDVLLVLVHPASDGNDDQKREWIQTGVHFRSLARSIWKFFERNQPVRIQFLDTTPATTEKARVVRRRRRVLNHDTKAWFGLLKM